ncbi:MAG: segregation/condensation protein A [Nocardioidaceae bacterium]|nr:segregation/condensation protein A [Nocardioidaceae bacterium]
MTAVPTAIAPAPEPFAVHLDVFSGPFDLLLGLIAKHELDITEIALSQVTDEFIAHTRRLGAGGDLEQTTQFLVVAATLLDLKAAKLLPRGEVEDEDDLAVLEARDLLFARLLQYRAFQQVADTFAQRLTVEEHRHPRAVKLEPRFAELLPEVLLTLTPDQFAEIASRTLAPRPPQPELTLGHMYTPAVSVREQTDVVADLLRTATSMTFRALVADAPDTTTTVARFLGLLNLFRDGVVGFDQATPLGELHVRWTGGATDE